MKTYELCKKFVEILPKHTILEMQIEGLLNTVAKHNRRVDIDVMAVQKDLNKRIEKAKQTIMILQKGIDVIESLPKKQS